MTIRDIAVAFGIEVDQKSVSAAESAIKGVKNMASKLLGAIGRGIKVTVFSGVRRFGTGCLG